MKETERIILLALSNIQNNQVSILNMIKDIHNKVEIIDINLILNTNEIEKALAPNNKDFGFKDTLSVSKVKEGNK